MSQFSKKLVIAIDGHSSCGKSTVAKALAKLLNYTYIDSGAMYRAITLFCISNGLIDNGIVDEVKLKDKIKDIDITFKYNSELNKHETYLNNENIEDEIRGLEVSNNVSIISKVAFVREEMVRLQQKMGDKKSIVMDGRDIGTVVFPNAEIKIFMTADVDIRAERRYKELTEKGDNISLKDIEDNIRNRDFLDETRDVSPLRKADDAIFLNNSKMTREEQLSWILDKIENDC